MMLGRPLGKGALIRAVLFAAAIAFISPPRTTAQAQPPVVYSTPARRVEALIRSDKTIKLEGRATYTLTAASDDDSLRGIFTITLSLLERQSLADFSKAKLADVPESFSRRDTIARFAKGTSCPSIELDFPEFEIKVHGGVMVFSGKLLRVPESADKLVQQLCFWTRQINVNKERVGIIRSINRMIEGDKPS